MTQKWANLSRGMLFTWSMLAGLIFLFLIPKDLTSRLQLTYARVFRWPLAAGRGLTLAARTAAPAVQDVSRKDYGQLRTAYRQSTNEIANLQAQLQEALRRIGQLQKLRANSDWERMQFRPADVIAPADQAQDELIINRGQEDDVAVGQFVMSLDDHCIVGTVSDVSAKGAKVRLITDPGSRMAVNIADLNVPGLMEGRGNNTARVPLISTKHRIRKGDPVYARKQTGLEVPVLTARVTECREDADRPLVWDIKVQPVCDVANLSELVVVISGARPQP